MSKFILHESFPKRTIQHQGKEYLYFGGTAYLGLTGNKHFQEAYIQGIRKYGLNLGTSRQNNVQLSIYEEAERNLADRFSTQDAILTSSGYLASQLVYQYATSVTKNVFISPKAHPANTDGIRKNINNKNNEEWIKSTIAQINSSNEENSFIFSNTLDNLYPELYSFKWLESISQDKNITLVLDDAHGLGIIHENRSSITPKSIEKSNINIVIVASLAKGFSTDAGIVLGKKRILTQLRTHPIYLGASPPSPAGIYALINTNNIYLRERKKLLENIKTFSESTPKELCYIQNFPVFTFRNKNAYKYLLSKNIIISSFPYPLISDPKLDRIILSSCHSESDIKTLLYALSEELY